jgi:SAM dependent carboxyl methyltransferase
MSIGRSFYESLLPPNSVHVGWSAYAAMWITRIPALIPGHFAFQRSAGEVRAAWERQGAEDWETFLALRARELRPGGCLVVSVPGADENGVSVFERVLDHANAELVAMVNEGAITAEERRRMALSRRQQRAAPRLCRCRASSRSSKCPCPSRAAYGYPVQSPLGSAGGRAAAARPCG